MSKGKCPDCHRMVNLNGGKFVTHSDWVGPSQAAILCPGGGKVKVVKGFMSSYKTYDPAVEGHGGPKDWSSAFQQRLGFEEAEAIIAAQDDTPRGILGVGPKATWDDIKKAYRAKAMACHPDLCPQHGLTPVAAEAAFKKLSAAFTILERQFGKA